MNNYEIRSHALKRGVRHWQIAKKMGLMEFSFSRILREELPEEKKAKIIHLIDEIAEEMRGEQ